MNPLFEVTILDVKDVHALPGVWTEAAYRQLLALLEFEEADELPADEVPEMALMALQDVGDPHDAAERVLELLFGDAISAGVRQQIAHEFDESQPWAEHSDMSRHALICAAADALHRAYPKQFMQPTIAHLKANVAAQNPEASQLLAREPQPALLVRLLADGMDEQSTLHRLFEEQLAGNSFPEAPSIIWRSETSERDSSPASAGLTLDVYSSWNWLEPLKGVQRFESSAHPDAV